MKQNKLVRKIYEACLSHKTNKLKKLYKQSLEKIFDRKKLNKTFTVKYSLVNL